MPKPNTEYYLRVHGISSWRVAVVATVAPAVIVASAGALLAQLVTIKESPVLLVLALLNSLVILAYACESFTHSKGRIKRLERTTIILWAAAFCGTCIYWPSW